MAREVILIITAGSIFIAGGTTIVTGVKYLTSRDMTMERIITALFMILSGSLSIVTSAYLAML